MKAVRVQCVRESSAFSPVRSCLPGHGHARRKTDIIIKLASPRMTSPTASLLYGSSGRVKNRNNPNTPFIAPLLQHWATT